MSEMDTKRIEVGDKVRFDWGVYRLTGKVVEDRGNIGNGRQRLLRIQASVDTQNAIQVELPEDMVELIVTPTKNGISARSRRNRSTVYSNG
jgi:hypothetical protein